MIENLGLEIRDRPEGWGVKLRGGGLGGYVILVSRVCDYTSFVVNKPGWVITL